MKETNDNIVVLIPARSGSKRVIDKNIKPLNGKPLISYSIITAKESQKVGRIIVSTNSEKYKMIAKSYGAEVPFLQPEEISTDTYGDYGFVKHLIDWFFTAEKKAPEYIVLLRPTSPLREVIYIDKAIDLLKQHPEATSLRSIEEMPESAYKMVEMENGFLKSVAFSSLAAAGRPGEYYNTTYKPNGYVDILKSSFVTECKRTYGDKILAFVTPHITEIDSQNEFDYLEYEVSSK